METATNDPGLDPITAQIKGILTGEANVETEEAHSEDVGSSSEEEVLRGDDSGQGPVDMGEHDATDSLEAVEQEAEDDDSTGESEPVDLEFLAEKLEVDKKDLYELEIPLGDGEKTTLGALKDAFKEYGPVEAARKQVDEAKDRYERDLLATRQQINNMVPQTPEEQAVLDRMMQRGTAQAKNYERQQHELVLETIPEWKDSDARAKDRESIVALGAQYGFSEAEMAYTHDARTLRMLRDMARDRARVQEIEKQPERERAKPNATGKRPTGKLTKRRLAQQLGAAKRSTHLHDKAPAIKNLLNG